MERKRRGRKGRRRNDRLVSPSRGRMDGKTEEARMAEAASFGQVASPERADLPLHLAWARFLALRHRKDARPPLGLVCPNHGRFISTREKKRGSAKSRRGRVTTERGPLSLGECGQFGTGRERNAITHVPRGSRTRPPQYRGRRPPGPRPAPLTTDAFGIQQTDYCALRWLWWLVMVGA